MELREQFREVQAGRLTQLKYPVIPHFLLFGQTIEINTKRSDSHREIQSSML